MFISILFRILSFVQWHGGLLQSYMQTSCKIKSLFPHFFTILMGVYCFNGIVCVFLSISFFAVLCQNKCFIHQKCALSYLILLFFALFLNCLVMTNFALCFDIDLYFLTCILYISRTCKVCCALDFN